MLLVDQLEALSPVQLFFMTIACGAVVGAVVIAAVRLSVRALKIDPSQPLAVRDALITSLSGMFALMVAFSAAGIWNDAIQARAAVQREANAIENAAALAAHLPDGLRGEVRDGILQVARRVVERDWPAMKRRVGPNDPLLERVSVSPVVLLMTHISRETAISASPSSAVLLEQLIDLRSARLQREMIARGGVSPAQWVALLIIPIAALVLIALAYNHDHRAQLAATTIYVIAVCAALFVILAHDRPFVGFLGVRAHPIEVAVERIQQLPDDGAPPQAAQRPPPGRQPR